VKKNVRVTNHLSEFAMAQQLAFRVTVLHTLTQTGEFPPLESKEKGTGGNQCDQALQEIKGTVPYWKTRENHISQVSNERSLGTRHQLSGIQAKRVVLGVPAPERRGAVLMD
jgi:CubicO group peptidase (beta-lactamase class C family)